MRTCILLLLVGSFAFAAEADDQQSQATPYPFDTCLIAGTALDSMGGPYVHVHDGQELKFCCKGCLPAFKKDVDKHMQRVRAAVDEKPGAGEEATASDDSPSAAIGYPLTTCAVSGAALDSMGEPYVFVHEGQEIKLCCKGCKARFLNNAEELMKPINEALSAESDTASAAAAPHAGHHHQAGDDHHQQHQAAIDNTTTCLVSGEALEVDMMVTREHDGQTLRFCCKGCGKKFARDPARYLDKLDQQD